MRICIFLRTCQKLCCALAFCQLPLQIVRLFCAARGAAVHGHARAALLPKIAEVRTFEFFRVLLPLFLPSRRAGKASPRPVCHLRLAAIAMAALMLPATRTSGQSRPRIWKRAPNGGPKVRGSHSRARSTTYAEHNIHLGARMCPPNVLCGRPLSSVSVAESRPDSAHFFALYMSGSTSLVIPSVVYEYEYLYGTCRRARPPADEKLCLIMSAL